MLKPTDTSVVDHLWIVIPAYNVARHLGTLIMQLREAVPVDRMIVVNDGSSDDTGKVAEESGVRVVTFEKNRGKGLALRTGFQYARSMEARWIMTIDGDLQHDPRHIPEFIQMASRGSFDLIIGARRRGESDMPWDRRFSNWSTSLLLRLITGRRIEDAQCGFRLFRAALLDGVSLRCRRYDFETEYLLSMIRKGARIGWVPISTLYKGGSSSIRRLPDTMRFLRVVGRYLSKRNGGSG